MIEALTPTHIVTVEMTHFFETCPLGADAPVYITVKLDFTPGTPAVRYAPVEKCRPAEGGEVVVLGTEINLDSKIDNIPEDFLIEMATCIKDIRGGVYDDELYQMAELELFRITQDYM